MHHIFVLSYDYKCDQGFRNQLQISNETSVSVPLEDSLKQLSNLRVVEKCVAALEASKAGMYGCQLKWD